MRLQKSSWPRWKFVLFGMTLVTVSSICAILVLLMQHQQQDQVNMEDECDWQYMNHYRSEDPLNNDSRPQRRHQMHEVCSEQCPERVQHPRLVPVFRGKVNISSCDDEATARGPNQKVVAYSLYGDMYSKYFNGTSYNIDAVAQMYPGWIMRLYHNLDLEDDVVSKVLCDLWCHNDHLDICDVHHLPSGLGDQQKIFGMIWRFFVLGDPLVDRFIIRDIDSLLLQREVDAVTEWIQNGAAWHVMRDHRYHTVPIMGGMWGGTNRNLYQNVRLRQALIRKGMPVKKVGLDQDLLKEILWPVAQKDVLAHDSYCCQKYNDSKPFPTRRQTMEFVGDKFPWDKNNKFKVEECPAECRPKNHPNWKYC